MDRSEDWIENGWNYLCDRVYDSAWRGERCPWRILLADQTLNQWRPFFFSSDEFPRFYFCFGQSLREMNTNKNLSWELTWEETVVFIQWDSDTPKLQFARPSQYTTVVSA